ncbi:MAG: glycerol-3-phosphate dehydrogenase/oxidase [Candidatus Omnitrophica bacterium]|nr:glycerol-3-phosphate dehydrogenase/oxidase [Candidatus Omnitrophota bacterium]MDE2215286.1 glycerol-3-phosphate dehydrogenase/oxidase [Candidatus Omnitrophota bacterium]
MIRDIARLTKRKFDLLVVGGGINGAAIAYLAAAAGASVALLDKGDFACGTSSKSTKLLHGGLRYLEHFEFDLVRESLKERFIQWQAAPHLVKAMPFVVPVYKNDPRPLWMVKLGVCFYDLLSGRSTLGRHRFLSFEDTLSVAPGLNPDGLMGAVEYFDAQMDDARICLENVLMADLRGAVAANYVKVEDFIKDRGRIAVGVRARDVLSGRAMDVFASTIIVAAGPWTDQLIAKDVPHAVRRLRPTKGVHIVYRTQVSSSAFLLQSHKDARIFFVIPFKGHSLIGTTDTDFNDTPDSIEATDADIRYLLQEAGRVFPHINFDASNIITTFAGIRPLVADVGAPSRISRKHVIERNASGIYFVMGGKYTTYRRIAEEAVSKAMPQLSLKTSYAGPYVLYGSGGNEELKIISRRFAVAMDLVKYLQGIYGSRLVDVLELTRGREDLKKRICSCSLAIAAQVIYSRDVEMAQNIDDIVDRRLGLSYLDCPAKDCRRAIAEILKT